MDPNNVTENEGQRALTLVKWLSDHAIGGGPFSSAQDLATGNLRDQREGVRRLREPKSPIGAWHVCPGLSAPPAG